ncbi:MAG: Nodulation efficiency protein NfeD [Candidatus Aminicenantes bacterium]|nr:Nodulation efficiency protein NfeD [Candidatus Aminicenantes bacterium]
MAPADSYNEGTVKVRLLVALSLLAPVFASAAVVRIRVDAPIHPVTSEYIVKSLDRADREAADLLILTLDTPGGLDTSMREIIEKIVNARTPVAAFVGPSGSRAASAGFLIALACDIFVMAPGTSTGSAHPVGLSLTGQAMDKTMEEKVTNDAAAYVRSIAGKRGRNVQMAEDAVRKSLSYTEKEALDGGLIDLIASSEDEIAAKLDGRTIRRFDGTERVLALAGRPAADWPMTFRQRFLMTVANPNLAYILLMIGLLGLYFEFSHPGAILPGVLGGISLLLAVFAFQILPINYVGLGLIILAIILFILEIKVQSFGMLAVGGIAAMIIGSLMLIKAPITELRPSLGYVLPVVLAVSLIVLFLLALVFRAHRRRSVSGRDGLVGETGTARTDLSPAGRVFVHGELWQAEADEIVRAGEKVKVVEVLDGLKIRVGKI